MIMCRVEPKFGDGEPHLCRYTGGVRHKVHQCNHCHVKWNDKGELIK